MAQIQKGTTYTNGGVVNATNLNAHVDGAILLPGAITDQISSTAVGSDQLLVSKSGVLNKVSASSIAALANAGNVLIRTDGTIPVNTGVQLTLGTTQQIAALNAVSKGHLDAVAVAKSGSTMTGPLQLPANPTAALQAATKQYVDAIKGISAWCIFNGTTGAIIGSYNVTSVTRSSTGRYAVVLPALPSANYAVNVTTSYDAAGTTCGIPVLFTDATGVYIAPTTTGFKFATVSNTASALTDFTRVTFMVIG